MRLRGDRLVAPEPRPGARLIEAALPLEAIARQVARESARSRLHLWWSPKPAAACRAVLFASLVGDPGEGLPEGEASAGRAALCELAARLGTGDEVALQEARRRLRDAHPDGLPMVCDPFCGGGAIPAEARRLGLPVWASDLNPVAVLSTAALIDFPGRFGNQPAVHPSAPAGAGAGGRRPGRRGSGAGLPGSAPAPAAGLVEDVLWYGRWVRDRAEVLLGPSYPPAPGGEPIIAWVWCRTARCPNPACGAEMPLVHSFWLSTRPGRQAWVAPLVDGSGPGIGFAIGPGAGAPEPPPGTIGRNGATCVTCRQPAPLEAVRRQGHSEGLGVRLLAMVAARAPRGRSYLPPDPVHEVLAAGVCPTWTPETELAQRALGVTVARYGLKRHADLFTPRQLRALATFSDLVREVRGRVLADGRRAGRDDDGVPLRDGGRSATAYADAVCTYLALALDRTAARWCSLARWQRSRENVEHPFASPGLQLAWDFAEANPFSPAAGGWLDAVEAVAEALERAPAGAGAPPPVCRQMDAAAPEDLPKGLLVCTDPPYFDNLPYADTSDLFYVWLRRTVGEIFPDLCRTVLTPKAAELVADPHRHGGRDAARRRFLEGMGATLAQLRRRSRADLPLILFYALRQGRPGGDGGPGGGGPAGGGTGGGGTGGSGPAGWEAMLESLLSAGLQITGTWPLRTEHPGRRRSLGSNALASSVVLVCRPRPAGAPEAALSDFLRELRRELPRAVEQLAASGMAPLDLAQAAIGPGMAVFSRYGRVLAADGSAVPVAAALRLINRELDATLAAGEADLDPPTRFCLAWFEQFGFAPRPYGDADVLLRAKNAGMEHLLRLGAVESGGGTVRLRRPGELPRPRGTAAGPTACAWVDLHLLLRAVEERGEAAAGALLRDMGRERSGGLRTLAHRLSRVADRRGMAGEAHALGGLLASWHAMEVHRDGPGGVPGDGLGGVPGDGLGGVPGDGLGGVPGDGPGGVPGDGPGGMPGLSAV